MKSLKCKTYIYSKLWLKISLHFKLNLFVDIYRNLAFKLSSVHKFMTCRNNQRLPRSESVVCPVAGLGKVLTSNLSVFVCTGRRSEDKHHPGLRRRPRSDVLQRELHRGRHQTHVQGCGNLPGDRHRGEQSGFRGRHAVPPCNMWEEFCVYLEKTSFSFLVLLVPAHYAFHFLLQLAVLQLPRCTQCTTFCTLSLSSTRSPTITKQTSEVEQIPLHFHSSQLTLRSHSAHWSLSSPVCNRADHPWWIHRVTDATELTYWSGSTAAPTNLSIQCANRANRATTGSGVPQMKNNTQMAANGPSAGANPEQTLQPPSPCSAPTYKPTLTSLLRAKR